MDFKKFMFVFVLICITIFLIFYYIFSNLVNNMSRSQDKIVEDVLNKFNNYEANIEVIIKSNKSENKYSMNQIVEEDKSKTIVNGPENIKGMTIELGNNTLKITNANNMEKIYNDYKPILNNSLFLNSFVNDYKKNGANIQETNDEIIIQVHENNNLNTYTNLKKLHLDKTNNMPKELIIGDNTKKENIRIIYNDIKIK